MLRFPENDIQALSGKKKLISNLVKTVKAIQNIAYGEKRWDENKANMDSLFFAAQTGNRVTMNPASAINEFRELDSKMASILKMINDQSKKNIRFIRQCNCLRVHYRSKVMV